MREKPIGTLQRPCAFEANRPTSTVEVMEYRDIMEQTDPSLAGSRRRVVTSGRRLPTTAVRVLIIMTHPANAAACINGVYRAGCTGPYGSAVVRKSWSPWYCRAWSL
jgi:hypothetical protein